MCNCLLKIWDETKCQYWNFWHNQIEHLIVDELIQTNNNRTCLNKIAAKKIHKGNEIFCRA